MAIVQAQPTGNVWEFENEWNSSVCSCCYDVGNCCYAHWCFPCFMCRLQSRTNECLCTGCIPGGNTGLRTKIRTGFRIRGGVSADTCIMCCFPCCGALQMLNELEFQGL